MVGRTKVVVAAVASAAAIVAGVGIWYLAFRQDENVWVRITTSRELANEGVVFDRELRIYIVHTKEGPLALSAKVPHERTDYVRYCRSSELFESHYLAAKFDRLGIYSSGPGERSLDRVALKVERGFVYVNPGLVTPGPARLERTPMEPKGPFCVNV